MKDLLTKYLVIPIVVIWIVAMIILSTIAGDETLAYNQLSRDTPPADIEDLYPAVRLNIPGLPSSYGSCDFTLIAIEEDSSDSSIRSVVIEVANKGSETATVHLKDIYFFGTIPGRCSSILFQPADRSLSNQTIDIKAGTSMEIVEDYPVYSNKVASYYLDIFLPDIDGQRITVPFLRPDEAMAMLQGSDDIGILDVRSQEAYEEGHLPGAISFPSDQVMANAATLLPDRESTYFINCKTGARSSRVSLMLIQMGYENIYNIGGIDYWPADQILLD